MSDSRVRDRMVFETTEVVRRAIRLRAGMDGLRPAEVINRALTAYLAEEIRLVAERMREGDGEVRVEGEKPARKRKEERA